MTTFLKTQFSQIDWSIRSYPATIGLTTVVAVFGLYNVGKTRGEMNVQMARFGVTWESLEAHRFWAIPISTFLQSDPNFPWLILFFAIVSLFLIETLGGSLAALVTFLAADWISSPLTPVALRMLAVFHDQEAQSLLGSGSTGSSAAFHGCFAAAAMLLPKTWAKRMFILLVAVVIFQFLFERLDNSIAHAIATFVGAALGHWVWTRQHEADHTARAVEQ